MRIPLFVLAATLCCMLGCSEDPPSANPNPQPDIEMGQNNSDMQPDLGAPDSDADTDSGPDIAEAGRLVIQPVSGSGLVKGSKFRAHIQVGRLVDVSPGK